MIGGGFGARGEVEITHQNDMTRRVVSIRTARSMAVILNVITLCAYLVIWLFWWWILIRVYEPRLSASSFRQWWECVRFVATEWGRVMGRTWPLWLIPLPLEWPTPLLILYIHNLLPKLLNDNFPATFGQMDPNKSGAVTWANWDERAGIAPLAVAQPATLVTLDLADSTSHRYLTDIALVPELQQFAQGVLAGIVSFSERGATGCHWDKAAFQDLRDQMIERKMITWKNGHNKQSGYNIGPVARRALGELARPLPHSPG